MLVSPWPVLGEPAPGTGCGGERMKGTAHFLLDVWREACRPVALGDALARAMPVLQRHLPADLVLLRALDPQRRWVETLAAAGDGVPARIRSDLSAEDSERLAAWCG